MQSSRASYVLLAIFLFGPHLAVADSIVSNNQNGIDGPVIISDSDGLIVANLGPDTSENATSLGKRVAQRDPRCNNQESFFEEESLCLTSTIIQAYCISLQLNEQRWFQTECPANTHCVQRYTVRTIDEDLTVRMPHARCSRNVLDVALSNPSTTARIHFHDQGAGSRELLETNVQYWKANTSANASAAAEDTQFRSIPDGVLRGDFTNAQFVASQPINITTDQYVNVTMVLGSQNQEALIGLIFWDWLPIDAPSGVEGPQAVNRTKPTTPKGSPG